MNENDIDATADVWLVVKTIAGCALVIVLSAVGYVMVTTEHRSQATTPSANQPLVTVASVAAPVQYEYITVAPPDEVYESTMNRLGTDGWEMVSQRRASGGFGMAYEVTLKRQKRAGQKETTSQIENLRAEHEGLEALRHRNDYVEVKATETATPAATTTYPPDTVFVDPDAHVYHWAGCLSINKTMTQTTRAEVSKFGLILQAHDCAR